MKDQVQMSKIIKKHQNLQGDNIFEFDLENNQPNTLEIQMWDYDIENASDNNMDQNLIGVGFLEVP